MQRTHDISVIICAYTEDRWNDLIAAVESVQQQTLPPREIIIVIDHNPALLQQVQEHIPGVLAIENREAKGLSGARNSGAAAAQGGIVAFLDDDAIAEPKWMERLFMCYDDPQVVGVGGKIEPLWLGPHPSWFPDEFNWVIGCTYRGMSAENSFVRNLIGANMSMRRHILIAAGGFHESFGRNLNTTGKRMTHVGLKWPQHHAGDEETELCIRVMQQWTNGRWLYTPSATVRHRVPAQRVRWTYFLRRCYDEGLDKAMLVGLHGMQAGLSSERTYTFEILPQGVLRGLTDVLFHCDPTGLARVAAIVLGLAVTTAGYLVGMVSLWVRRLKDRITGSMESTTLRKKEISKNNDISLIQRRNVL